MIRVRKPRTSQPANAPRVAQRYIDSGWNYVANAGYQPNTNTPLNGLVNRIAIPGLTGHELDLVSAEINNFGVTVGTSWSILTTFRRIVTLNLYPYFLGISGAANAFALASEHAGFGGRLIWYDGVAGRDSGFSCALTEMVTVGITFDAATLTYKFYKNGVLTASVVGANTGSGTWQFAAATSEGNTHDIFLLAFANKAVSVDEMQQLGRNTWLLYPPFEHRIPVAGAAGTTLILADANHAHPADNIALTQDQFLTLQDALSAHLADAVVLTQAHNIALADMLHAQAADNLVLSQVHAISVFDASHTHSADGVILTQAHSITLQDVLHPHLADAIVLGAAGTLTVSDGLHAHLADGVVLTQQHVLLLQGADHAHVTDTIALTQAHNLTLADALHAQIADNVVFSGGVTLVLSDAAHPHAADSITLSVAYSLAIQDAIHATLADNLGLGQVHQIIVSDALHAMLSGNIAFSVIPTPDSRVLLIKAENRVLVVAREERTITIH